MSQGTAFTYQGRLNDGANPANGIYDLRFALFDAVSVGTQQGGPLTNSPTAVSNGLFAVTLDFGAGVFNGADRWLEISVRTNGGGAFTTLSPRQPLTPAPYAIYAGSAATLATTNSKPLNLTINGTNVLRIESVYDSSYSSYTVNSVGGYSGNEISNGFVGAFIGGGGNSSFPNRVGADYASILGGIANTASGNYSTVMGTRTIASGPYSTAMGQDTTSSGLASTALGNFSSASGYAATAIGNYSSADGYAATAMGYSTTASGDSSTAMGYFSTATASYSTALGNSTHATDNFSTAMGLGSIASGPASTAMGYFTTASNSYSLSTGAQTLAGGLASTAMGNLTVASGDYSTAMGYRAKTRYAGTFVWADSTDVDFDPFSLAGPQGIPNSFNVRSTGGFFIASAVNPISGQITAGVQLTAGSGTWGSYSDRSAKTNFSAVDTRAVLEKLARIPVETWNYKAQAASIRHIGPMAQDFAAAFHLGEDDKHITTIDADGVALAAIQGLNEKVEASTQRSEDRIQKLETENADLKKELANLKRMVEMFGQPRKEN